MKIIAFSSGDQRHVFILKMKIFCFVHRLSVTSFLVFSLGCQHIELWHAWGVSSTLTNWHDWPRCLAMTHSVTFSFVFKYFYTSKHEYSTEMKWKYKSYIPEFYEVFESFHELQNFNLLRESRLQKVSSTRYTWHMTA